MRCMVLIVVCSFSLVSAGFSESSRALHSSSQRLGAGLSTFTEVSGYNAWDFGASPLGLMEKESSSVSLTIGYRTFNCAARSSRDTALSAGNWILPQLLIGSPRNVYLLLHYTPYTISEKSGLKNWNFPLQRFGLTIAGQAGEGIFRIGLSGSGFYGKETMDSAFVTAGRDILGVDNLGLYIGSQLHKLVRIGFKGGVSVKVDTSISQGGSVANYEDRYSDGRFPFLGADIDVGTEGFPVKSEFDFLMATSRFTSVAKGTGSFVFPPARAAANGQHSPMIGDTLAWKWQTMAIVNNGGITYRPSVYFGYWSSKQQIHDPIADDHDATYYLFNFGPAIPDANWTLTDFDWGIGGSFDVMQFGTAWFEYARSSLSLVCGSAFTDADHDAGYDRIGLGLEVNINAIPGFRMPDFLETCIRLGYLNLRENAAINSYRADEFGLLNTRRGGSQNYRYNPANLWGPDQRVSDFTLGLGGYFFKRMFEVDINAGFLSLENNRKYSGFEFGFDLTYNVKPQ